MIIQKRDFDRMITVFINGYLYQQIIDTNIHFNLHEK